MDARCDELGMWSFFCFLFFRLSIFSFFRGQFSPLLYFYLLFYYLLFKIFLTGVNNDCSVPFFLILVFSFFLVLFLFSHLPGFHYYPHFQPWRCIYSSFCFYSFIFIFIYFFATGSDAAVCPFSFFLSRRFFIIFSILFSVVRISSYLSIFPFTTYFSFLFPSLPQIWVTRLSITFFSP